MASSDSYIVAQKAGKILAVNSDPEVIRILGVNLTHANLEFVSAQSGVEAIDKTFSERPDIILLGPPLPDIDLNNIFQRLQRSPETSQIPIIIISATKSDHIDTRQSENGTIHYITKPFDPNEIVNLVQTHLRQKRRVENIHPLTGLPNQAQVIAEMTEIIDQKKAFAVIYIVLENLTAFNKNYGYLQGDRAIRLAADIITEKVRIFGNQDDLVGHVNGNKFVIISTPSKAKVLCHRITTKFNRRIRDLYTDEEIQKDDLSNENPDGNKVQNTIMSLCMVLVTNEKRTFRHYLEVYEAITTQMDHSRHSPDDNTHQGIQTSDTESEMAAAPGCVSGTQREELRVLSGVLDWLDFTIRELEVPLAITRDSISSLVNLDVESLGPEQKNTLKTVSDKVNQLERIIEGLNCLTRVKRHTADVIFEEVEMGNTLEWVVNQVRDMLEQRDIHINVSVVDKLSPISIDRRTLTECLLYLIKNEIQFLPPESRLDIRAADVNEKFLTVLITNPRHQIPQKAPGETNPDALKQRIYPAKLMLQGLGGKLNVTSEKEEGTIYTLIIPKKWHSWMQETSSLQQATETVRKEAQSELTNIRHLLSSISEQVPPPVKYSLEKIKNRIQELGVLCNRTLFLTEDLNSRLEIQQESLLQQEIEQLASLEAILAVGREIARSMNLEWVFRPERAEFVSKWVLSIAREYKLSESDCQSLRYAAMIDDLGLVLSPQILTELALVSGEEATRIRERFYPMWKALSGIPFLKTAIIYVRHIYNMYGINGSHSEVKGADVPLGAKILYLVSTFERLISGLPSREKLSPNQALNRITNKSGWCFESYILNTFLQLWRRQTPSGDNASVKKLNDGF